MILLQFQIVNPFKLRNNMNRLKHLGLIPDGNRRWARENNIPLSDAYWVTMKKIAEIIDLAFDRGITIMSVYALSKDNLDRPKDDLDIILGAETKFLRILIPEIVEKYKCKVIHAGLMDNGLPGDYKSALLDVCEKSKDYEDHLLNLLIVYDPIDELKHAVKKDPENFMEHLWVKDPLDMLIRTGFEKRLSNFLPLQCGYAEADIIKKYFPDITKEDIIKSIETYTGRKRRFGG